MNEQVVVGIAGKQGPFQNVATALAALDLSSIAQKSVLIKPNLGRVAGVGHGYNTHPEAVAAVVEAMQKAGASKIAIGESPLVGINTMEAFERGGITEVAQRYGVELLA